MKIRKNYYNMPFGHYCGVMLDIKLFKKVSKLLYKQNEELKTLLENNIDRVEVAGWTLIKDKGEQKTINYFNPKEDKLRRLEVMNKSHIKLTENLFKAENMEDAKNQAIEYIKNGGILK
jgi:hypothetical protein